jgi:hypothetical protein
MATDVEPSTAAPGSPPPTPTSPAPSRPNARFFGEDAVQHWEIHSELVLVSPEVRRRALEVLATERALHLLRNRPLRVDGGRPRPPARFLVALGLYVGQTVAFTAGLAAVAAGATVVIALLLELADR